ncbi:CPBP family intramembrane glutamic endopeptidase [Streptococcus pluranimalium]
MKNILTSQFNTYRQWPTSFLIVFACVMVEIFFLAGSLVFEFVISIFYLITQLITQLFGGLLPQWHFEDIVFSLHFELLSFAFVAILLFAWVKWMEKRPLVTLGFYRDKWLKEIFLGFGVGALQFTLSLLLICLLGGSRFKSADFSFETILFVLSLVPFWLIQGGTEELLTRGWLLQIINSRLATPIAISISSLVFGLMHLGNEHVTFLSILDIILSGIVMALYMIYRDNIWGVIGLHGAWNFVQGNIYGIEVSGGDSGKSILKFINNPQTPDWLSGGSFGTEGSLITCLVEVCFMLGILYLIKRQQRQTGSV